MRCAAFWALLGMVCASQTSLAQTSLVDTGTGAFIPIVDPATFTQPGPVSNAIGLVQTGTVVTASIDQFGFYNRAAVIEVATTSTDVSLTQVGAFSHALVVQVSPTNTAAIVQNGSNSTAILNQSATSAIAGLSPAGLSLLAANFLDAPETAAALPRLAAVDDHGFARSMFDRLDADGPRQCLVPAQGSPAQGGPAQGSPARAAPLSQDAGVKPPLAAERCGFALFLSGNVDTGDRKDSLGVTGFSYTTGRISFGAEYTVSPGLVAGPIFDISRTGTDFDRASGRADLDAFHAGAYASYSRFGAFAHVVAAYGLDSYLLTRPGFLGSVTARPDGDSVVAASKFGYLFDLGPLRMGPVGTLSYARGAVDGFTESGDSLLTQRVAAQTDQDLVGGGGLRLRFDVPFATAIFSPFLDVMAEHAHPLDQQRILSTAFSFAPAQTLLTPVRSVEETYGRVVGGASLGLSEALQLGLAAQGTFARPTGDAFAFTGNLRLAF